MDERVGDELADGDERILVDIAAVTVVAEADARAHGAGDPGDGIGEHPRQGTGDHEPVRGAHSVLLARDRGGDGQPGEVLLRVAAQCVQARQGRLAALGEDIEVEEHFGIGSVREDGCAVAHGMEEGAHEVVIEAARGGAGHGGRVLAGALVPQKQLLLLLERHAVVAVVLAQVGPSRLLPSARLAVDGSLLDIGDHNGLPVEVEVVDVDGDLAGEALPRLRNERLLEIAGVLDADDGHGFLAHAQQDGAAPGKVREGGQGRAEGGVGVLGEGLRLDLEAVAALELQAGERLGEIVTIHNHVHSVYECV